MSVQPSPFTAAGQWYRGCLHAHTTESDGGMPPEKLLAHYRLGGFDFVALTDHRRVTDRTAFSQPDFLVLRGTELNLGRTECGTEYHIVGIGVDSDFASSQEWSPQTGIDEIGRHGGVAIIAHPYWTGLTSADLLAVSGYAALEVFNTGCEGEIARGFSHVHWDDLLSRGLAVRAVASDDTHWPGFDSLHAWTVVRAPELTAEAVVEALHAGHFYASTGPEIYDVRMVGNEVTVECSPATSVALVCNATRGGRVGVGASEPPIGARRRPGRQAPEGLDGGPLTGAMFQLRGDETYARVQVTDARGCVAWTNPLFVGL